MCLAKFIIQATAMAIITGATIISLPASVPASAVFVDPSFPSTSFELSTFSLYAQTSVSDTSANQYSINLINEIFQRTGGRPLIRVGGTTGDTVKWNSALAQPISPAPGTSQTGNLQIGPNFWPLLELLSPTNTLWMPQISYTDSNYTNINEETESIVAAVGISNLGAIEIGNEPNLYGGVQAPSATNAQYYATRFQEIVANISSAASIPSGAIFAGPDLAGELVVSNAWTQQELFQNTNFDSTGNIKYATDHWYRCLGRNCGLAELMNHTNTVSNTNQYITPSAQFFSTYNGGQVKYFLDEINIQSGGTANQTFAYSLATALYGVDFMMYLMTLGVVSVNWEQVYNSNQNVWQPSSSSTMAAQTKNIYYALITAAEFIGTGANTKVAEITPVNNDGTAFSTYAAFEGNAPARVALCNLNYWDQSLGSARPNLTVELDGIPSGTTSVTVKYLTNPGGAGQNSDNTTFGGSQWPFSNLGAEVTGVQSTTVEAPVNGGTVQISSPYSSIAIVYLCGDKLATV